MAKTKSSPRTAQIETKYNREDFINHLTKFIGSSTSDLGFNSWFKMPEIQEAYHRLTNDFIKNISPYPKGKYRGRGIVICGGGAKYFPSVWVGVNRIRQLGVELPIELWHLGEIEMDLNMKKLLEPFGVTCKDAFETAKNSPARILNGWELKPFAILHSQFKDVMYIDADCVPIKNPIHLFDSEQYHAHGTIFWPDYPHWLLEARIYSIFGCKPPRNTKPPGDDYSNFGLEIDKYAGYDVAVESGQMLINKEAAWDALNLATFWCSHSDYYFRFVHGDKEAFHLAWRRLNRKYAMPMRWPNWDLHTCMQYDFKGDILWCHRNGDKWKLDGNTPSSGRVPFEKDCFRVAAKLAALWSGRVWENTQPNEAEKREMAALAHKTYFYHRKGFDARLVELLPDNVVGKGQAEHEMSWSIFMVDGNPRLVFVGKDSPTCFLYKAEQGKWKGNWLINEQMMVELIPIGE